MMQTAECPHGEDAGVYVLGGLSSQEHEEFKAHLDSCDTCVGAVARWSGLPAQLNTLDPEVAFGIQEDVSLAAGLQGEDVPWAAALPAGSAPAEPAESEGREPPGELLAKVRDIRSAPRRRRTWRHVGLTVAAAALLVAVGAAGGSAAFRQAPQSQAASQSAGQTYGTLTGAWQTVRSASLDPGAVVMYRSMGWGTQLQAEVTGLPPGVHCQLIVLTADGPVTAGGWVTDAQAGTVFYPASAGVHAGQILKVEITAGNRPPITVPVRA